MRSFPQFFLELFWRISANGEIGRAFSRTSGWKSVPVPEKKTKTVAMRRCWIVTEHTQAPFPTDRFGGRSRHSHTSTARWALSSLRSRIATFALQRTFRFTPLGLAFCFQPLLIQSPRSTTTHPNTSHTRPPAHDLAPAGSESEMWTLSCH